MGFAVGAMGGEVLRGERDGEAGRWRYFGWRAGQCIQRRGMAACLRRGKTSKNPPHALIPPHARNLLCIRQDHRLSVLLPCGDLVAKNEAAQPALDIWRECLM